MRVVIGEDQVLLREGLARVLAEFDIEVVAQAGDGNALLREVETHQPDVAICDVRMPPTYTNEGIQAALVIRDQWPQVGVLVFSQYVEERYAVDLLAQGSSHVGYLLKDRVADVAEFTDAVRRVGGGGTALDPEVVAQLMARTQRRDPLSQLTPREKDVLNLMAEGRTNTAIAGALYVSESAVEKYVSNIFSKLDLPPAATDHRRVLAVLRYLES